MLMVPYLTFVSYNVDDILGEQSDIEKFWTDGKNLSRETCIMVEKVYNLVNNILREENIWPWRKTTYKKLEWCHQRHGLPRFFL